MNSIDICKVSLGINSYKIFIGKDIHKSLTDYISNYKNYSKTIVISDKNILEKNSTLFAQLTSTIGLHGDFDPIFYCSLLFNDAIQAEPTIPEGVHLV